MCMWMVYGDVEAERLQHYQFMLYKNIHSFFILVGVCVKLLFWQVFSMSLHCIPDANYMLNLAWSLFNLGSKENRSSSNVTLVKSLEGMHHEKSMHKNDGSIYCKLGELKSFSTFLD